MLRRTVRLFSQTVTIMPGDGIGPEVADSVVRILDAAQTPILWEHAILSSTGSNTSTLESLKTNKIGLKGPTATPIGSGHVSLNVLLRRTLQLFANVRPCKSIPGVKTRFNDVDVVTIRENTEGEYSGKEHEVVPGVIENLKVISEKACWNVADFGFEYAKNHGRKKIHALHKAAVMKMGDGLFLKVAREVSKKHPEIAYEEKNVDTGCGILVSDPGFFDVMLMPNLYGDIVSDVCAGLVGGLGLTPSGNIGKEYAVFEAVHGSAPDIAGKNMANPTALLLSTVMMLRYLNLEDFASKIEGACFKVLSDGITRTKDLGGTSTTTEYTNAIIKELK